MPGISRVIWGNEMFMAKVSMLALRKVAMRHPGVEEGIACEGTALERRTLKVRNKAFVFLGASDVMLKLDGSLAEAAKLAKQAPARFKAGSGGWVKISLTPEPAPPLALFTRWIDESYALFAAGPAAARAPKKKKAKKKLRAAR